MPRGRGQPPMQVLPGTVYADLTVIREIEPSGLNRRFLCRCTCGTETAKFLNNLRLGKSRSCGCTYTYGAAARAQVAAARRERAQVSDKGRICHTCGEWKPWARIAPDKRRDNGRGSNCMDCSHWRTVKSLYGITRAEWDWLLASQDCRCMLCGEPDTVRLNIDHDHACCAPGRACKKCIRGMLCRVCNRMLGHVEAKPALRARFADYLDQRPFMLRAAG